MFRIKTLCDVSFERDLGFHKDRITAIEWDSIMIAIEAFWASLVRMRLRTRLFVLDFQTLVDSLFWPRKHWNEKFFVKYKVVALWISIPMPPSLPLFDDEIKSCGRFTPTRSLLDSLRKLEFFMSWTDFYTDLILSSNLNIIIQIPCFETWIFQHKYKT